jgi:hypothetical protein
MLHLLVFPATDLLPSMKFWVFTAVTLMIIVFWDVSPFSLVGHYEVCCLSLQGRRVKMAEVGNDPPDYMSSHLRRQESSIEYLRVGYEVLTVVVMLASCFHTDNLLSLFDREDGDDMFLRNFFDFQRTTRRYIPEDSTVIYVSLPCWICDFIVTGYFFFFSFL